MTGQYSIKIYLIRDDMGGDLPPEQYYSTSCTASKFMGTVVSAYKLKHELDRVLYYHPSDEPGAGSYSAKILVQHAMAGKNDLKWISAGGWVPTGDSIE